MNYQHSFHAGSAADVLKHVVLTLSLDLLVKKPKPLLVLDTHAGDGLYRIASDGEAAGGILRVWPERARWPTLDRYFTAIGRHNGRQLRSYPGSPLIASSLLRATDRLVAIEETSRAHVTLQQVLRRAHSQIFLGSAWQGLPALLPPPERRALILIDPPYEAPQERRTLLEGLKQACVRFRQGVYLIWYPIKDRREADRLRGSLAAIGESLTVELLTWPADVHNRLNGSGMVVINPPFGLKKGLSEVLPSLAQALTTDGIPRFTLN